MKNLYQILALELAKAIDAGVYQPGDKMPGIRSTSANNHVSPSTAVAAYRELELEGYIEARPRSGFYVKLRKTPSISEPEPIKLSQNKPRLVAGQERVLRLVERMNDTNIVQMGSALPDSYYLPTLALEKALISVTKKHRHQICHYEHPLGSSTLRKQLAQRMNSARLFNSTGRHYGDEWLSGSGLSSTQSTHQPWGYCRCRNAYISWTLTNH